MAAKTVNQKLLEATEKLSDEVEALGDRLSAKELLYKRTRNLTRIALFLVALVFAGFVASAISIHQVNKIVEKNAENAKVSCLNTNESRKANRTLWRFIIDYNLSHPDPSEPPLTLSEKKQILKIGEWIDELYAPRDCNNLGARYDIPKPPAFVP